MINSLSINPVPQSSLVGKTSQTKKNANPNNAKIATKAENIAAAISNGTYQIDIEKTARAIVDSLRKF
ncbi:MAG: flagellar biosynthesis anti-sigma factor FlgM [Campylobacter sp.]|nr:flagellar biosynthesis anti-sigma factor FlgM [Campylobacter sp.]